MGTDREWQTLAVPDIRGGQPPSHALSPIWYTSRPCCSGRRKPPVESESSDSGGRWSESARDLNRTRTNLTNPPARTRGRRVFSFCANETLPEARAARQRRHDTLRNQEMSAPEIGSGRQLEVGILGATGMVGQQFVRLLAGHPWFRTAWLGASERSEGRTYAEAMKWRLSSQPPADVLGMQVDGMHARPRAEDPVLGARRRRRQGYRARLRLGRPHRRQQCAQLPDVC